jgi:hypothetical protein
MPACEVYVTYQNHQICVVRTNWATARLYVDDELLDITSDLYASGVGPTLMGLFGANDAHIEVFIKPAKSEQVAIRVNGVWICGNRAHAVASD